MGEGEVLCIATRSLRVGTYFQVEIACAKNLKRTVSTKVLCAPRNVTALEPIAEHAALLRATAELNGVSRSAMTSGNLFRD